jgi:hypothetical protein
MMGDSLTRYQYLNLVYLLEHGKWPQPDSGMCNEKKMKPWWNFYNTTNAALRGREICDCNRGTACCSGFTIFENRRYHNPELQTTVWYVQWFGDRSFPHGHVRIMDAHPNSYDEDDGRLPCMPYNCSSTNDAWMLSPAKFLEQFVTNHRPHAFVFNSGLHTLYGAQFTNSSRVPKELHQTLLRMRREQPRLPTRLVWKTTTPMYFNGTLFSKHDGFAAQLQSEGLVEFFDTTAVVKPLDEIVVQRLHRTAALTWDNKHFHCWVHEELNLAMVRQLFARRQRRRPLRSRS